MMETRLDKVELILYGDHDRPGLPRRVERIEQFMFVDPQTGAKGMVSTVEELSTYVQALRNTLRVLNWLLGLIGLGGLVAIVRWFGGA